MLKRRARVLFVCRDGDVLAPLAVACARATAADWLDPYGAALEPRAPREAVRAAIGGLGLEPEPSLALAEADAASADLVVTLDEGARAAADRLPGVTVRRHRPFDPPDPGAPPDAYLDLRARICAEIDAVAAGLRLLSRMDDGHP